MKFCNACGQEKEERKFPRTSSLECKNCRRKKRLGGMSFYLYCWSHFGKNLSDIFSDEGSDLNKRIHREIKEHFHLIHGENSVLESYFLDSDGDAIIVVVDGGNRTYLGVPFTKKGESALATFLKRHCLDAYSSTIVEFECLKNPKTGRFLPFDIYIRDYNVFVEVNGVQHYKYVEYWHRTLDNFKNQQRIHNMKREYAMENGHLIEIDVDEFRNDFFLASDIIDDKIAGIKKSFA